MRPSISMPTMTPRASAVPTRRERTEVMGPLTIPPAVRKCRRGNWSRGGMPNSSAACFVNTVNSASVSSLKGTVSRRFNTASTITTPGGVDDRFVPLSPTAGVSLGLDGEDVSLCLYTFRSCRLLRDGGGVSVRWTCPCSSTQRYISPACPCGPRKRHSTSSAHNDTQKTNLWYGIEDACTMACPRVDPARKAPGNHNPDTRRNKPSLTTIS